jgi:DNA-binding CsgD family transcriptional regulator
VTELVARRCRDHDGDERALRTALVDDIRRRVPFGWHVWALVDPETEVAISPLATVPEHIMAQLPGLVRRRYLTPVNRWDVLRGPADSLYRATAGAPAESLLHRELLGPHGIGDVASMVFRDRFGCWGFLDLWRSADQPGFTDAELGILGDDVPAITDALRRCQARSFDAPASATQRAGPAVLFLSPELAVLGQTPETDDHLRALLPTDRDRQPVPAGAYNVAAALLASEVGLFDHPPVARVRPVGGTWLTFRAARIDSDRPPADRDIAVTIELTSPGERRSLYARCHGLSAREAELVDLLADGADTRAIAGALFVSEHTVQDHLKSIFAKTGTRSRRTLLARLAGR